MHIVKTLLLTSMVFSSLAYASKEVDWSEEAIIPEGTNRANIYNLSDEQLETYVKKGQTHAMIYPVTVTGLLIPYKPFLQALKPGNPVKNLILELAKNMKGYSTEKEF